jgi:hypothetical protein
MFVFQWQKFWGRGGGATKNFPNFIFFKEKNVSLIDITFFSFKYPLYAYALKDVNFVREASKMFHQLYFSKKLRKKYFLMIMGTFLLGGVDQKVHPILPLLKVIRKK